MVFFFIQPYKFRSSRNRSTAWLWNQRHLAIIVEAYVDRHVFTDENFHSIQIQSSNPSKCLKNKQTVVLRTAIFSFTYLYRATYCFHKEKTWCLCEIIDKQRKGIKYFNYLALYWRKKKTLHLDSRNLTFKLSQSKSHCHSQTMNLQFNEESSYTLFHLHK